MKAIVLNHFIAIACLFFLGCQSVQTPPPAIDYQLLNSNQFELKPIESQENIFALDDDIKVKLDQYIKGNSSTIRQAKQLLNFLMHNGDNSLAYQSGANLVASEAFYNLNANCLSLSILSFSLACLLYTSDAADE